MITDNRPVILSVLLARHPAHLEYVDEVRIDQQLNREVHRREIEVLEAHAVEKDLRSQ